jgi:alanyl-tRNA synthetase
MASIIQNVNTNFETDLIYPIIQRTEVLAEKPYGQNESDDVAMKVIADHSRAAAFSSATVCCHPTREGDMCCAGSCGGPSAMVATSG